MITTLYPLVTVIDLRSTSTVWFSTLSVLLSQHGSVKQLRLAVRLGRPSPPRLAMVLTFTYLDMPPSDLVGPTFAQQ